MTAIFTPASPRRSMDAPGEAGAAADAHYGVFPTVLGPMLVAGTLHGVSRVTFGDDSDQLEREFLLSVAPAAARRDDSRVAAWARSITAQLEGKARSIDVPIDVSGTPFQQRVWTELRRIPFGELRSYQELAISIGQPTAARAVAGACASNRVAVVIPCHRVVRGTGELGGYRWGVERKRKLLDAERRDA